MRLPIRTRERQRRPLISLENAAAALFASGLLGGKIRAWRLSRVRHQSHRKIPLPAVRGCRLIPQEKLYGVGLPSYRIASGLVDSRFEISVSFCITPSKLGFRQSPFSM